MNGPSPAARAWLAAGLWLGVIYGAIPYARDIQRLVSAHLGRNAFLYVVYLALAVVCAGLARALWRGRVHVAPSRLAGLVLLAGLGGAATYHLRANPEEAMHLLLYGVLSVLLFRALRLHYPDRAVCAVAMMVGVFCGAVDEVVQWLTPGRFFDYRDIAINGVAVVLAQAGLALSARSDSWAPARRHTWARALHLGSVLCLMLAATAAMTPLRLDRLRAALPGVTLPWDPMADYGFRHTAPGGELFSSRLDAAGLARADAYHAARDAASFGHAVRTVRYSDHLELLPVQEVPFLHELRVRVFSRNEFVRDAITRTNDPLLWTAAWHENQIAEAFFSNTLAAAGLRWEEDKRAKAEQLLRPGSFSSRVSRDLITAFSERQFITLWLALALVQAAAARYLARP